MGTHGKDHLNKKVIYASEIGQSLLAHCAAKRFSHSYLMLLLVIGLRMTSVILKILSRVLRAKKCSKCCNFFTQYTVASQHLL